MAGKNAMAVVKYPGATAHKEHVVARFVLSQGRHGWRCGKLPTNTFSANMAKLAPHAFGSLQGIFSSNGTAASSTGGGIYSAGTSTGWAVNVTGSVFIDNKISSGAGGEGANIRNGTFMFSGCQFTNTSSVVQTTGVKQASTGTAAVTGCTFLNVTTATDGTVTATGCIGA